MVRLVSLLPSATEIVDALGLGDVTTWAGIAAAEPDLVVVAPCGYHLAGAAGQALSVTRELPGVPVWAIDADGIVVRPSAAGQRGRGARCGHSPRGGARGAARLGIAGQVVGLGCRWGVTTGWPAGSVLTATRAA